MEEHPHHLLAGIIEYLPHLEEVEEIGILLVEEDLVLQDHLLELQSFVEKEVELAMTHANTVGKSSKTVQTWQSIVGHIQERSHTSVNSAPMPVLKVANLRGTWKPMDDLARMSTGVAFVRCPSPFPLPWRSTWGNVFRLMLSPTSLEPVRLPMKDPFDSFGVIRRNWKVKILCVSRPLSILLPFLDCMESRFDRFHRRSNQLTQMTNNIKTTLILSSVIHYYNPPPHHHRRPDNYYLFHCIGIRRVDNYRQQQQQPRLRWLTKCTGLKKYINYNNNAGQHACEVISWLYIYQEILLMF